MSTRRLRRAPVAHLGPGPRRPLTAACPVQVWCRCITTIFNYFVVTNFFWMFVEGCYLHTAIVMTYSTERLRKWLFLFIGWCEVPGEAVGPGGEGALLTRSPPFILGPRTGPQPCLLSPGQSEDAHSLPLLVRKEQIVPPKEHFTSSPPLSAWKGQSRKEKAASITSLSNNLRKPCHPLICLTCLAGGC